MPAVCLFQRSISVEAFLSILQAPYGFSLEALAAVGDAATGRSLYGHCTTVNEMLAALDKD